MKQKRQQFGARVRRVRPAKPTGNAFMCLEPVANSNHEQAEVYQPLDVGQQLPVEGTEIPLLDREHELKLTRRLAELRRRYRHAALCSWSVLAQVLDTFERIQAGQLSLDRTIDAMPG